MQPQKLSPDLVRSMPAPIQWAFGLSIVIGSLAASYAGILTARSTAKTEEVGPPLRRIERHVVENAEDARVTRANVELLAAYICVDNGGCPFAGMAPPSPGWTPPPLEGRPERHKSPALWNHRRTILDCGPDGFRADGCPGPLD